MSAPDNLSPQQFIAQHVGFDRWAKSEIARHYDENTFEPGHARFDRPTGERVAHLRNAREWLENHYSASAHQAFQTGDKSPIKSEVGIPLHEILPFHTDLVHDYEGR